MQLLAIFSLPHPGVTKCAVNPHNCHMAVTVGEDGYLRQWRSKQKYEDLCVYFLILIHLSASVVVKR